MVTRVGSPTEVQTVAARNIKSGHLHECPDGRVGVYWATMDAEAGEEIVLHTDETLEVAASAIAAASAGALVNFNFTPQTIVASGGTNIGRYVEDKALNATSAIVLLNSSGPSS